LGREMFIKLRFGLRSKKFKNHCFRPISKYEYIIPWFSKC